MGPAVSHLAPAPVPDWATPLLPVGAAVAALLAPHGEVVLHDLAAGQVVAVWNAISGRRTGDPSSIADSGGLEVGAIGPYAKAFPDGRAATSVSAVVPDAEGRPCGLLCVNVDRGPLDSLAAWASSWLAATVPAPDALLQHDWRETIGRFVHEFCVDRGHGRADRLDPGARSELIARLDAEGLFAVRRAAELVASALGVSRATVYSDLGRARATAKEPT
jgi:D-arginine utilization repressor